MMEAKDKVLFFFREFSKYALSSRPVKHALKMENGTGRCSSCGKIEHRNNLYLLTRNYQTFPVSEDELVGYLVEIGDLGGLSTICRNCCGEGCEHPDDICSVYWIRMPDHTDIFSEGYVGISSNYKGRLSEHIYEAKRKAKKNKEFERALNEGKYIASELLRGSRSYCLMVENKLRPEWGIGWNKCIGGEMTTFKHGLSSHPLFYIMQSMLSKAKKRNIPVDVALQSIEGRRQFLEYLSGLQNEGEYTLIDDSIGVTFGNVQRLSLAECRRKRLTRYLVEGQLLCIPELAEKYGIKQNTLIYRLRRGESILVALRLQEKNAKTVKVNGVNVRYNGSLKQDQIDEIVSAFLAGETRNSIAVRLGIPPRPVYTILEKGGL